MHVPFVLVVFHAAVVEAKATAGAKARAAGIPWHHG